MTHYYIDPVMHKLFEETKKKLEKIPGKILTREELQKLIPGFDQPGDGSMEERKVHKMLLTFKILIKLSKNRWRVRKRANKKIPL